MPQLCIKAAVLQIFILACPKNTALPHSVGTDAMLKLTNMGRFRLPQIKDTIKGTNYCTFLDQSM